MPPPRLFSPGRRLFLAFSSFIGLYALASSFAISGIVDIHNGLAHTRARTEGMRVALDLATAVRDQYAHVAHTIILGNASHATLYGEAAAHVQDLVREMKRHAESADEQAWVDEIDGATRELDGIFKSRILPGVLESDRSAVQADHHSVLAVVGRIQEDTDRLARRFEQAVPDLQTSVADVERRSLAWGLFFLLVAPVIAAGFGLAMIRSLKEHEVRLLESERLASIGRLAAGVAHEINNPLGVILGYVRLLAKRAGAPREGLPGEPRAGLAVDPAAEPTADVAADLAADLAIIEEETLRCREIVEGLLDLSRPLAPKSERVELRELCDDLAERLGGADPAGAARIRVSGEATVEGDPARLRQVLLNLAKNGAEAAGPGGWVDLSLAVEGAEARVTVCDSGPGLTQEAREHLFELFFTTKPKGTGLGLAVSKAIARAHGGELEQGASALGGACFRLRLPLQQPLTGAAEGGAR